MIGIPQQADDQSRNAVIGKKPQAHQTSTSNAANSRA
jgi:hypothetical protein